MSAVPIETWQVEKAPVSTTGGVVVSQHWRASEIGARALADGGNAVDAAVATGLAVGVVEPWMSGIGGAGFMLVYVAAEHRSYAIEFGVRASSQIDPSDYPLVDGEGADLFTWPAVCDNRNISGPYSVAVPGTVAGLAAALEAFGSRRWSDLIQPAIRLADEGLLVDWHSTIKIAGAARDLSRFAESRSTYLPGGHVPVAEWAGDLPRIQLGRIGETLRRLADAGPGDFYTGQIAKSILEDAAKLGICLNADDLASYVPHVSPVGRMTYRGGEVDIVPGLTAGPTLRHSLSLLASEPMPTTDRPDAGFYLRTADALRDAYAHRLAHVGDIPDSPAPSCTTHLGVADRHGNVVALTMTLLSVFGSKVMLPGTGILMNNGIMWFDPRPGTPNSIRPGRRPLSNMCPAILLRDDGLRYALGASGGRRIMPAVLQLISFLADYRMAVGDAVRYPRIDVSGKDYVTVDARLPDAVAGALSGRYPVRVEPAGVYPNLFACPNIACHDPVSGTSTGAAFINSPVAAAMPEAASPAAA